MKNLLKFLGLSVLVSFIALGCSNTSDDAVSLTPVKNTAMKTITLVATGDEEAISFPVAGASGVQATIVADAVTASTLKYYLFTTNKVGGALKAYGPLTLTAPDAAKPNVGTVPLSMEDGFYLFQLYATNALVSDLTSTTEAAGKALFLGQTEADLRTSTDTVSFYMTTDNLTGAADIALKLKTTDWNVPTDCSIAACITSKTDGAIIDAPATTILPSAITTSDPTGPQFSKTGFTAGTYNFEVRFTRGGKTYTWSDTIIVNPNNKLEKTIAIPNVIDMPPAAPTAFNATFKDSDSQSDGYYNVEFSWKAVASVNEDYFQIELLEIPVATDWSKINADTSTKWSDEYRDATHLNNVAASWKTILGADFYGQTNWRAGSLRKNNTSVTVALPFGKRYLARIAAVNDAGPSDYCYVDFGNTDAPAALSTGYSYFAATSKVINRYRLTYKLLNGTVTLADDSTSQKDIVEYRTQNTEANADKGSWSGATPPAPVPGTYVPAKIDGTSKADVLTADIWNPECDTDTTGGSPYKSLMKGEKKWTSWRKYSSTSSKYYDTDEDNLSDPYTPPDYTGCENLVLYASYSPTKAAVTIYEDDVWTIGLANLAATGDGVTATGLGTNGEITLNLKATGTPGTISWTGTYTSSATPTDKTQTTVGVQWTKVTYEIYKAGQTYTVAGPNNCAMTGTNPNTGFTVDTDLSAYRPGKYLIKFNAYVAHKNEPYTATVAINITEE